MIQNERQYKVTKAQLSKLRSALATSARSKDRMDPRVYQAMVAGIRSQMGDLRGELQTYEKLRAARSLKMRCADELGGVLVQARIARGLTQAQLARRVGIRPQQVQRYEATAYRSASLNRILEVMKALGVDVSAEVAL